MLFFGKMNLQDLRVDKMLKARGLDTSDIYYSPIKSWVLFMVIAMGLCYWFIIPLALSKYYSLVLIYLAPGYLFSGYLNHSFAITEDQLHVINPNFPFRQFKSYALRDIQRITLNKSKQKWHYLLGIIGSNYISIQTADQSIKYFCVNLDVDAFDENWTEKTMDTFYSKLKEKGLDVVDETF
jgi:hypothetical protein